jgi:polysaccharide deacetylase
MGVTLFVPSGLLGDPSFLRSDQLLEMQAQGHEIAGHTVDHLDLSRLSPTDQTHQICDDRIALESAGFKVTDFAYPFGNWSDETRSFIRACGYESARDAGGLRSYGGCSGACPPVESIPPADPYRTRTIFPVLADTGLSELERYVTRAEALGGGWVQFVFHHVCDGCDPNSVSASTLAGFMDWLAPRAAMGTQVKTVRQVIDTPFRAHPLTIEGGTAGRVRLRAAVSCPSTPVTAACVGDPRAGRPTLHLRAGSIILVAKPRATRVELEAGRLHRRAHPIDKAGHRWRIEADEIGGHTGTFAVTYRLGVARYRFRVP